MSLKKTMDKAELIALEKLEEKQEREKREKIDSSPFDKVRPEFEKMLSHYREYPDLFLDHLRSKDALFGLTPFQRVYLRTFLRYKKVGIVATRGMSKCVTGDTLITTSNGLVKIGDLAKWEKEESEVVSFNTVMNMNGEMEMSDIIVNSGYKDTKKIRTRCGYELEGTHVHPVITLSEHGEMEFKTLSELQEGDYIAINRKGHFGSKTALDYDMESFYTEMTNHRRSRVKSNPLPTELTEDLAYYIGSLIGDGTMGGRDLWSFTSADKESVEFFDNFNRDVFGLETKHYVYDHRRYDYKVHSVYTREFLRQIGVGFEKSNEKTVPNIIMSAPKHIVASFLQGLFDTDGTAVRCAVQYSTSSEEMSMQVQQLLLQFGIIARRSKHFNKKFKTYSYKLNISSINIDIFAKNIGFRLSRKAEKLDELCKVKRNVNIDIIPHQASRVKRICDNSKMNYIENKYYCHVRNGDNQLTHYRLENLLNERVKIDEDYATLFGFLEDNFYWDTIESIEDSANYVYDFHVPETHTFIGNGFVNHNTYVNVLGKYVKCILFPNNHEAIAMPTKNQSAKVTQEKITEIWRDYPALKNEIKEYSFQKDYVKLVFKNGSTFDTLTVGESSRGLRANGISLEEIVDPRMDRDTINEVILPILAQPRRTKHGVDPNEVHLPQAYITTASHKQSYAYEKFSEIYGEMVTGKNSILLISSYEMGVRFGTLRLEEIQEKMDSPTYSPLSFEREMKSVFTGSSEDSLVSSEDINNARILETAEHGNNGKRKDGIKYILAYDVARSEGNQNAQSSLVVIKAIPRGDGSYARHVVNIYTQEGSHFKNQALFLKQKVEEFKASVLVVDSNGLGKGVVDYLVTEIDENPPYSVINDDRFNSYKTAESIPMLFLVSSQSKETKNADIVNRFMANVKNGDIKLLKSEALARGLTNERDSHKLVGFLLPYIQTDRLIDEVMNLEYVQKGNTTTVKQVSNAIEKDRYSALAYGNFYIYLMEQKESKKKSRNNNDATRFFSMKKPKFDIFNRKK